MGKFASRLHCFGDVTRSHPTTDAKCPVSTGDFCRDLSPFDACD